MSQFKIIGVDCFAQMFETLERLLEKTSIRLPFVDTKVRADFFHPEGVPAKLANNFFSRLFLIVVKRTKDAQELERFRIRQRVN